MRDARTIQQFMAILARVIQDVYNLANLEEDLINKELNTLCQYGLTIEGPTRKGMKEVCYKIPELVKMAEKDAQAIYDNDPAANSLIEIILCYPGYVATLYHRIAHEFYNSGFKLLARVISESAHSATGIDIHPGAKIGKNFAIDHGTGIVIGETAEIGDNVVVYQGVTLGAIHLESRLQHQTNRHQTIKDNVVIYANATILGGKTVIGENSIIGANTFIVNSVEPNSKVYYTN